MPDMFPLIKQVHIAVDFSRGVAARLGGVDVPTVEGCQMTIADLDVLLAETLTFLDSLNSAQFEGRESTEIVLRPGTPKKKRVSGHAYLANYGLPQSFFMSVPPARLCATTVWPSASVTTWARIEAVDFGVDRNLRSSNM